MTASVLYKKSLRNMVGRGLVFISKRLHSLVNHENDPHQIRSSRPEVFLKKVFLEISQNLQENICARVSFLATLLKKRLWHRCFPVNIAKFLRPPFLTEHLRWLFLSNPFKQELCMIIPNLNKCI